MMLHKHLNKYFILNYIIMYLYVCILEKAKLRNRLYIVLNEISPLIGIEGKRQNKI